MDEKYDVIVLGTGLKVCACLLPEAMIICTVAAVFSLSRQSWLAGHDFAVCCRQHQLPLVIVSVMLLRHCDHYAPLIDPSPCSLYSTFSCQYSIFVVFFGGSKCFFLHDYCGFFSLPSFLDQWASSQSVNFCKWYVFPRCSWACMYIWGFPKGSHEHYSLTNIMEIEIPMKSTSSEGWKV
jgi:hypothetical protein